MTSRFVTFWEEYASYDHAGQAQYREADLFIQRRREHYLSSYEALAEGLSTSEVAALLNKAHEMLYRAWSDNVEFLRRLDKIRAEERRLAKEQYELTLRRKELNERSQALDQRWKIMCESITDLPLVAIRRREIQETEARVRGLRDETEALLRTLKWHLGLGEGEVREGDPTHLSIRRIERRYHKLQARTSSEQDL
jgi:hypothetical protein